MFCSEKWSPNLTYSAHTGNHICWLKIVLILQKPLLSTYQEFPSLYIFSPFSSPFLLHLNLWEIWDCLVLNHPKPKRPTSLQEPGGWETSRKGLSWEVSAADPVSSPSSTGQADEGGSIFCFLLLPCGSITDLSLSPRSEKVPNRKLAWSNYFHWPPADSWELVGRWRLTLSSPSPGSRKGVPSLPSLKVEPGILLPLTNVPEVPCIGYEVCFAFWGLMGRSMPSGNFSAQNSDSLNEIQQLTFFFPPALRYCFVPAHYFP